MTPDQLSSSDLHGAHDLSRRGFLKSTVLAGVGVVTTGAITPQAMARSFLQGKTAADIRGAGVEPGIVDLDQGENALGPSPMAVEAVRAHLLEINRYMNSPPTELYTKLNQMSGIRYDDLDLQNPTDEDRREIYRRNRVLLSSGGSTALLRATTFATLEQGGHVIEAEGGYGDISGFAGALKERAPHGRAESSSCNHRNT